MSKPIFNIETLGEAMRLEPMDDFEQHWRGARVEAFRLSREERDHIAGHALDSIHQLAEELARLTYAGEAPELERGNDASSSARKIAALSNLLGDIGWEREGATFEGDQEPDTPVAYGFGELFPTAQLRPWLEEWQRQDDEALKSTEETLGAMPFQIARRDGDGRTEGQLREAVANAQTKLGTGAILLARLEKWIAAHGN